MCRFIELTDRNLVTSVVNLAHVRCITVTDAGQTPHRDGAGHHQPVVSVVFTNGEVWAGVLVPTVVPSLRDYSTSAESLRIFLAETIGAETP